MFCTYITIYSGTKLPPFYIGSSTMSKINNGYRGSVSSREYKKIWMKEPRENPQLFKTIIISKHQTRKDATIRENDLHHKLNVVLNPLYINKAYASPDGFCDIDKKGKNNGMYGVRRTGENNPMFGKKHSNETKEKMKKPRSIAHPPKTKEFKELMRLKYAGKTYEERFGDEKSKKLKEILKAPKSEEHKKKLSATMKNKPKITCPYCKKSCSSGNYSRWHGDNCKSRS